MLLVATIKRIFLSEWDGKKTFYYLSCVTMYLSDQAQSCTNDKEKESSINLNLCAKCSFFYKTKNQPCVTNCH